MKYLSSLRVKDLSKEACLLRVDFNVEDHSNPRIFSVLPTIKFLLKRKDKIIILSHRGRPQKIRNQKSKIQNLSLKPFAKILSQKLKRKINFVDFNFPISNRFFADLSDRIRSAPAGSIFMLENLRFFPGEENNNRRFAEKLVSLGTFYVNDAFGVSHRFNASISAITRLLPSYAGLRLQQEIRNLNRLKNNYKRPLVVILGGKKISDKIGLIKSFYGKADYFLTGGGIANTIFCAQGLPVGDSLVENIKLDPQIMAGLGKKIILPIDVVRQNKKILDIGALTIKKYKDIIKSAQTIIWNGPLGLIEKKKFRKGSEEIAMAIAKSRAYSVIGGGETSILFEKLPAKKNVFISTGGGAMLEFLAGKKLPGIAALDRGEPRQRREALK